MNPVEGRTPRLLAHRYEVGALLGRGGMASVHVGVDTRLGRQVAIKMLRDDLARDPSFHARFRREAQSAAALNHPSIVAVYDTGEDVHVNAAGVEEHTPFIVMEHVHGRTVREILRSQEDVAAQLGGLGSRYETVPDDTGGQRVVYPLEVDEAAKIAAGVLSALEYSHRAGIVHRDIKPANVMVTTSGDVKVMDFGIARALADSSATMTQTQAVIGTAQYLSPEQARGDVVDARSDLYSAGCLLFEMLTGRPPFVGDSPVSVAYQHVREEPTPPSRFNPEVPEALDRVVLKSLAKDRDERYPDAHSFRVDLQAAVAGRPVHAPPVTTVAPATAPTAAMGAPPFVVEDGSGTVTIGRVEEDEPPRRRVAGYVGLALAVIAVFAAVTFAVTQLLGGGDDVVYVDVPTVVDLDRPAAKAAIEGADLVYAEGEAVNDDRPPGTVVSQDPVADQQVPQGTTVTVVLSLGPAEVSVPSLQGMTQSAARAALERVGLELGEVTRQDDPDAPRDTVMASEPAEGQMVAEGTVVSIVLSSGEVQLPDLTGSTTAEARSELLRLGLEIVVSYEDSDETPDTVIRQEPATGKVPQKSTVRVVAAQAPPVTVTPTPTSPTSPTTTGTPTGPPTGPPPEDGD